MRFETTVTSRDDDGTEVWDAVCHDNALDDNCFRSVGWATEELAQDRIDEHTAEHLSTEAGRELEAFRRGETQAEYEERLVTLATVAQLPAKEDE